MALFTTVDESYSVQVFRTFAALWDHVVGASTGRPQLLGQGEGAPRLTKAALKAELATGVARVYNDGDEDWVVRIQSH